SQVMSLADRFAADAIAAVWHGPKRRARETAQLLASRLGVGHWSTGLLDDRTPVPSAQFRSDYSERRLAWFDQVPTEERDEDGSALEAAWTELRSLPRSGPIVM